MRGLGRIGALDRDQAASAAFHSSDMAAVAPPSLSVLNCPFLIFSANSIPLIVTTALSNRLKPSIGRIPYGENTHAARLGFRTILRIGKVSTLRRWMKQASCLKQVIAKMF